MDAVELIRLGRQLTELGERALRRAKSPPLPNGQRLVLRDVAVHPGTSISEIVRRSGLRQSYVSESVYELRSQGLVAVHEDPRDGRRTLVTVTPGRGWAVARRNAASADGLVADAVGDRAAPEVVAALQLLIERLRPASR